MLRFWTCLAVSMLVTSVAAQNRDSSIDAYVRSTMEERAIPGLALAVFRNGEPVIDAGYGLASLELGVPVTSQTVFPIASVTKVFTATLVMKRIEEGKLALDQRLGDLLDGLPEAWRPVTVAQMLAHTSGLPDVIVNPMTGEWLGDSRDDALAKAAKLPMQFEPGTAWSYNQTNYVLLGAILERQSGKSFETELTERILAPLGLGKTVFGDARRVVAGRGAWYSRIDFSGPEPRLAKEPYVSWVTYPDFVHTCAALNTTASELGRFVDRLAAGAVLAPATVEKMWQRQSLKDGTAAGMDPETGMGLGWIVEEPGGRRVVGGTGGATVAFRHAVAERLTVVVLTNCQGANPDGIATEILGRLLQTPAGAGK